MIIGTLKFEHQIAFLLKEFNLTAPIIDIKNGIVYKNFDILLLFDDDFDAREYQINLLDIPVMGCHRRSKQHQYLTLGHLGIKYPNSFFRIFDYDTPRYDSFYSFFVDGPDELLIKANNGARGIGQIVIKRDSLYDFFEDANHASEKEFMKKWPPMGATRNEEEEKFLYNTIKSGDFFIHEIVQKVNEWRYIWFYDQEPLIVQREITEHFHISDKFLEKFRNEKIHSIANKIGSHLNTPWLSIDFYEEKNGTIGVFEYQMQYGYKALPKDEMIKRTINSVKNLAAKKM